MARVALIDLPPKEPVLAGATPAQSNQDIPAQLRKRANGLGPIANGNEAPVSTQKARLQFVSNYRAEEPGLNPQALQGYICGWGGGEVYTDGSETYAETWLGRCERVAPCGQEYLFLVEWLM